MRKWSFLAIIAMFLSAVIGFGIFVPAAHAEENMLSNGGFEDPATGALAAWRQDVWHKGSEVTRFVIAASPAHSGRFAAMIENVQANDAKLVQKVAVKPDTVYRLSGWILAEGAGTGAKGANLSVLGVLDTSADLKDTNGRWQHVELYGKTGREQKEAEIAVRLGGYGSLNTGRAYFDDVVFEEVKQAPAGVRVVPFAPDKTASAPAGQAQQPPSGAAFKVIGYALAYALLFGVVYLAMFRRNRFGQALPPGRAHMLVLVLLAAALFVRLLVAPKAAGHASDLNTFQAWAGHAANVGLTRFYVTDMFVDYPPGYIYVLYGLGLAAKALHLAYNSPAMMLLMKLPAMLADIAAAYLIYRMAVKTAGGPQALGMALLYAFNPAVFVNSAVWGQVDSFFALFLLLALREAVKGRLERSSVIFAVSVLIKPQALIFTPVLLFAFYRAGSWKRFGLGALYGAAAFAVLIAPFSAHKPFYWIVQLYKKTLEEYPYASLNAFNLFALTGGNWVEQSKKLLFFSYQTWGMLFIALAVGVALYLFLRRRTDNPGLYYVIALLVITAVFVLGVKMHERYWYPALPLCLSAYAHFRDRRLLLAFLGASLCQFANVAYTLAFSNANIHAVPRTDGVLLLVSFMNVVLLVWLVRVARDILVNGRVLACGDPALDERENDAALALAAAMEEEGQPKRDAGAMTRKDWLIAGALTLLYAAVALVQLGSLRAPVTMWQPAVSGESFTIDFGAVKHIDRVNSFGEIGDGKFKLEFAEDLSSGWSGAQTVEMNYVKTFAWSTLKTDADARYVKLTVEAAGFTLNELAFYEKDGETPIPASAVQTEGMSPPVRGAVENLFDEPERSKYAPTFMDGTYFDEIYHARTAYEHLHRMTPYENTHPPLGKLAISLGILLFGMNPFGWRIVGTLVGIAMVPLMHAFGKRLFKRTDLAFMASFLMTFDFMHFAQTRIATIDVYGVFFIVLMYYFMHRYVSLNFYREPLCRTLVPLFWSGLFFGIGAASKWIVLYGGAGLSFLFFASLYERYREYGAAKRLLAGAVQGGERGERLERIVRTFVPNALWTVLWCGLFFVVIPAVIYSASFLPYMTVPGAHISIGNLVKYQKDMFDYHSKLVATHGFASPWWEWPFMIKPIWYYTGQALLPEGKVSSIVSMGNPAVWWIGTLAVVAALFMAWKRRERGMLVPLVAFFSQYLPWMLVTRLTFIYHFFAMVPFLVLCIVYVCKVLEEEGKLHRLVKYGYMSVVLALFAMFYPILSGLVVDKSYVRDVLRWFPTWYFYS